MRLFVKIQCTIMREVFEKCDIDGSGEIETKEVAACLRELGYVPTEESVADAIAKVDKDGSGEINFDEFFVLMNHLRKTEGFTAKEVETFQGLFNKFDYDGSGEIETLELASLLRNLGYPTSVNMLQAMVSEVDVDGSGEIDFSELLKLLRKYRNKELVIAEEIFDKYADTNDYGERVIP